MKTAVEELFETWIKNRGVLIPEDFHQAKETEKQNIINARLDPLKMFKRLRVDHGYFGGTDNGAVIDRELSSCENYYNETFKKNQDHAPLTAVRSSNIVKEIRVSEILNHMMDSDMELYEKILNTKGFAYYFNELIKLAQK